MSADCTILEGDALARLAELPAESAQCVVTSPPYWGLRDYGCAGQLGLEPTPEAYLAGLVAVFEQVRRVLRGDGTLWLNMGDGYAASGCGGDTGASGLEGTTQSQDESKRAKAGQRIGHRSSFRRDRMPRQDKPHKGAVGLKPKDLVGMPWRLAFALQAAGWWLRQDIIWHKPNPMPESVRDRCTKAHEYLFLMAKSARYFYDGAAVKEKCQFPECSTPEDLRRVHNARRATDPTGRQRPIPAGWDVSKGNGGHGSIHKNGRRPSGQRGGFNGKTEAMAGEGRNAFRAVTETRNKRSVWSICTEPFPEAHFATFPRALVEPCIRAGSKPGDVVLDPFMGSGTVGAVALPLGRRFVGIELNPEYITLARRRITKAVGPLFAPAGPGA